jgi:hypothetical protein
LVERWHGGLWEEFAKLGPGQVMQDPELPIAKVRESGTDICWARFAFRYVLETDGALVRIASSFRCDNGTWSRFHYSYHYGPAKYDETKPFFRIDLDDVHGYHVHMPPDTAEHVPSEEVVPETKDIEPVRFVQLVAEYRTNGGKSPFTRKPR